MGELLRILRMPFQVPSLLFVGVTSLFLGFLLTARAWMPAVLVVVCGIAAMVTMLVWLTNYALRLIDDVANGARRAATASAEMIASPLADARAWVHPALAATVYLLHFMHPQWPAAPTLAAAAVLFPASIGACVISGRARDALNPLAIANVVRGIGAAYFPLVIFTGLCAALGVLATRVIANGVILAASVQLLLLVAYAAIGGAMYLRRIELGFGPRHSPEARAESAAHQRAAQRQAMLDHLFEFVRVRETGRALALATDWLQHAPSGELPADVHEMVAAAREWNEPREFARLVRGVLPTLLQRRQPGPAMNMADAALALYPAFAAAEEATTIALAEYALSTGRRRGALRMLDNYEKASGAAAGAHLATLRAKLTG